MVRIVKPNQRDLQPLEVPGATVRVSDPVVGKEDNLAAGFTEYTQPSRLEWIFDYDEVFYMLEGALEIHQEGHETVEFEAGDLGYIEKGTGTTIVVAQRAYLLHFTQPAWRE
jgi:ethanolamine utilization protein EutQ (cupin superfamily)